MGLTQVNFLVRLREMVHQAKLCAEMTLVNLDLHSFLDFHQEWFGPHLLKCLNRRHYFHRRLYRRRLYRRRLYRRRLYRRRLY
jgi:hypothetical protein